VHRVRIGVIGCGAVAKRRLPRLVEDGRVEITLLCDPDIQAAREAAKSFAPAAAVHSDDRAALLSGDMDAVVLCSPTQAHYGQACIALMRGLHVLAEKPLASSPDEVEDLIRRRDEADRILGVSYQRRFEPVYRTARAQLQRNRDAYGRVRSVHIFVCERWAQTIEGTWRDDPAVCGGYFADAGSHQIDACVFASGLAPTAVRAETESRGRSAAVVARVHAVLDGGAWLTANFVGDAQHWREDVVFHCEKADLVLRDGRAIERWEDNRMTPFIYLENDSSPDREFVEAIGRWRAGRADARTAFDAPAEAGLLLARWTDAVLASARSGAWIEVGGGAAAPAAHSPKGNGS
jgi:predicted dehydrogenase